MILVKLSGEILDSRELLSTSRADTNAAYGLRGALRAQAQLQSQMFPLPRFWLAARAHVSGIREAMKLEDQCTHRVS